MPTEDYTSSGHLVLFHLELAYVLMLKPVSTTFVLVPDFEFRLFSVLLFHVEFLLCTAYQILVSRNHFPKRPSGAPLHTLYPLLLRLCIALFVVAEGWLLLDIRWFVLLFQTFNINTIYTRRRKCLCVKHILTRKFVPSVFIDQSS